jgi:hypothetical protein
MNSPKEVGVRPTRDTSFARRSIMFFSRKVSILGIVDVSAQPASSGQCKRLVMSPRSNICTCRFPSFGVLQCIVGQGLPHGPVLACAQEHSLVEARLCDLHDQHSEWRSRCGSTIDDEDKAPGHNSLPSRPRGHKSTKTDLKLDVSSLTLGEILKTLLNET